MTAHLMLTQAFRFAAPALLAPFGYCQIVFAGLLGWLVFNHTPDLTTVVAAANRPANWPRECVSCLPPG
ncbi:hypothetical protein SB758_40075, partial [Burkholderia sp. SIMBA_013]